MRTVPLVFNDPRHWLARAAEARQVADLMNDVPARASMLAVAQQYELIADRAVKRLKAHAIGASSIVTDRPQKSSVTGDLGKAAP